RGWWAGKDIELRRRHNLIDAESAKAQNTARERGREALLELVRGSEGEIPTDLPPDLAVEVQAKRARSAAMLRAIRPADIVGEESPTNLPGTDTEYPNWRRRLALDLAEIARLPLFATLTKAMREERSRP